MTDNQDVGSYENSRNDSSMPPVGSPQPSHMGSQSSSPSKNPLSLEGFKDTMKAMGSRFKTPEGPPAPTEKKEPARGMFGWGGLTN